MSRHTRCALLVVATCVLASLSAATAGAASRTTVLASGRGATGLTAYGGYVLWSARPPGARRWRLMRWHAGRVQVLAAAGTRRVPFDADAGPDETGRPALLFSRCTTDPKVAGAWLQARGCRVMELPSAGPGPAREVALGLPDGVSATTPSRWRGALAFARHADDSPTSEVVVRPGPAAPLTAQTDRFVNCDVDCDQKRIELTVTSLDLGAQAVTFVRTQVGGDTVGIGEETQLIVTPIGGGPARLLSLGFVDGACGYIYPFAPTARGRGALWVAAGSPCDQTETVFAEAEVAPGRRRAAAAPGGRIIFGFAQDRATTYWLGADPRAATYPTARSCASKLARCKILRTTRLPLKRVARGRPLGPIPEEG